MENTKCDFCNKTFSNKSNLLAHQKTKSCLEKQGIKNEDYKCQHCSKILSSHKRLLSHIDICNLKSKNELSKYKSLYENNNKKDKKYKEKEKEYKDSLSKKDQEIILYKEHIQDLKIQLEKANSTIAEIAKQPKTISNDNRIRTQNNIQQSFDINDVKRISNILEDHLTPRCIS
jgi:hypothetical protein